MGVMTLTLLVIKCKKCKEDFEPKSYRNRICNGCIELSKEKNSKRFKTSKHVDYFNYIFTNRRYYQNAVYQFYRLFHDEPLTGRVWQYMLKEYDRS